MPKTWCSQIIFFFLNITWYREITHEKKESESEIAQSCLTLCDPMDCSLPGFSVHRIFQARVPEWVAISFSRGSSWDRTQVSRIASRRFTIWASFIREAHEKKSQLKQQTSMLSYFKKLSDLSFSNHHPNQSTDITLKQDPLSAKTLWLTEASDDVYYFSAQNFFFFFFFIFWLCGAACRVLVPQPGIEPVTTAVDVWSANHWTTGE